MNKSLLKVCILLSFFPTLQLSAQGYVATYDFANSNTTSGRTDATPAPLVNGINFGNFVAIAPAGNPNNLGANPNAAGRFSFAGWPRGATNNSDVFTGNINPDQYYEVTISPQEYYTLGIDSITFTVQRSGTGIRQYAVRSSADNYTNNLEARVTPSSVNLKIISGNIFQISDASTTAENGSLVNLTGFGLRTTPVTFRFYGWNAESTGTFSLDNVQFYGTSTLSPSAPIITLNTFALSFPSTPFNNTSNAISYSVQANNLTDPLVIATAAPFSISTTSSGVYGTSISIPAADAMNATAIYVKFSPTSVASYSGIITHNSTGATTKSLTATGDGIDASNLVFNFNSCTAGGTPGSGFLSYSVSGSQKWTCSGFGLNSTNGADMNGFSAGPQENEDWLISPPLSISSLNLPVLRFWSRGEFVGPSLQLMVSTDYDGSSDPNTATWTNLQADFPPLTNTWTLIDGIELTSYKSFPHVYIAFKYISSAELGASRWNVDEVDITNRTQLISSNTKLLNFGEVSSGTISASQSFNVKVIGYGDVTLTAPAGYLLSIDNNIFSNSLTILQAKAEVGTMLYAKFAPTSKSLKVEGKIKFTATDLDSSRLTLTGTSYPMAETFDAGTYNLSFFGSNPTNNPTPEKISTQVNNIAAVLKKLNLDVVGVEEVSNDDALNALVAKLPNRKSVISSRWSYSFNGPDPSFPPQKTGFIYDSLTMHLVEAREMFAGLYDSARNGYPAKIPNYPGGAINFWASGRLPFMATFDALINGVAKRIRLIDIHAKSSSDAASYSRRVYDIQVLKDTLNNYYKDDNIIIVGDYNDRLSGATYSSANSPYKVFVDEINNYTSLTLPLDQAGRISYLGGSALIDHLIISNELAGYNIENSTDIEDPRSYISGYNGTIASDHLPVYSRFNFSSGLPVTLTYFNAVPANSQVILNWATATEFNNDYFDIERSADNREYKSIARIKGAGNSTVVRNYISADKKPLAGINYYRLKQTDADGKYTYSKIIAVNFSASSKNQLSIYPNPVVSFMQVDLHSTFGKGVAKVIDANGKVVMLINGDIQQINQQINSNLYRFKPGLYILKIGNSGNNYQVKFLKQ